MGIRSLSDLISSKANERAVPFAALPFLRSAFCNAYFLISTTGDASLPRTAAKNRPTSS